MADDDELVYANPASAPLREALGLHVGQHLAPELAARIRSAAADPARPVIEVEAGRQTFALLPVALTDLGFINVYGTDITAAKLVARFPDLNPHPVFRVSLEGVLLYANAASRQVTSAFGTSIGEALPDDVRTRILGAIDGSLPASFEVQSSGRTYSLLPVLIPELGFVNVYGTDVTALKALDKFPDQNPNPVLRVSQDGRLIYANPASEPIRESFGVRVGEPLPPDVFARITERLDPSAGDTMEIATRRAALLGPGALDLRVRLHQPLWDGHHGRPPDRAGQRAEPAPPAQHPAGADRRPDPGGRDGDRGAISTT